MLLGLIQQSIDVVALKQASLPAALRVGFSGGCAMFEGPGQGANELLERADALLYRAKRSGKGKVLWRGSP